jgi:hypothetical protein
MANASLLTVVETPSFLRDAKKLLSDEEREAVVNLLSSSPNAGDLIKETGGVRKIRWAREDAGKSGAFRVIYFFHSMEIPLFILNVFAKNEKANVSREERNELKKLAGLLVKQYKSKEKNHERKTNR